MITFGLQSRIKKSTNSQQLYVHQISKAFNSCQFNFKRFGSANIEFQREQASTTKSHRSTSSKHKLFKSAKQIETDEKKRSNSFKNISLKIPLNTQGGISKKLFLNSSKQVSIPTKSDRYNENSTIMNEKKALVEDIIGRLRNKGSMRIQVKRELILNDRKLKLNVDNNEGNNEPQLNLKDLIKQQIEKTLQQQKQLTKPDQQMINMKQIIQQKSLNLTHFESQLGDKINWISAKMEQFQQRENQIKQKQQSINKKAEQLEISMMKKIEEQHHVNQLQLNKQFNQKIKQINQFNQNSIINTQPIANHSNHDQSQHKQNHNLTKKQTKKQTTNSQTKLTNINKEQQKNTIKVESQNSHQSQIVSFDSIQQIKAVGITKPQILKNDSLKLHLKKQQVQKQKPTLINNINSNNNNSNNNNKSSYKAKQQQGKQKQEPKPKLSKQQQKQDTKPTSNVKQKQTDQKQKHKIASFLKNINRATKLLYFIGEITSHFNANMKKIKKYQFKMANLYLLKYVYDRFRNIERTYKILVQKKDISQEIYDFRVEQNKSIKQSYVKLKVYVNKKLSFPNQQIEGFLDEQSPKLCCQDKKFFNKYLLPQIKRIVQFYHSDTGGKWTQHKVNLCYFRAMMAVFIISQIEFNKVVIDTEGKQHPSYMIDEMDKFNESQLKSKMTQAYQLFNELFFTLFQ